MSSGDSFNKEINNLVKFKKVYESIAFIALLVLIFQQFAYLVVNIINFVTGGFFSTASFTNANLQGFISRIVNINSSSWVFVVLGILAWFGYYVLLFFLVFRFSSKRKMSKWTWTLFVAFGPTIFLAPAFIWFILFAFRYEIYGVFKRLVEDYRNAKPKEYIEEEVEIVEETE
jgi:hypothetical protein